MTRQRTPSRKARRLRQSSLNNEHKWTRQRRVYLVEMGFKSLKLPQLADALKRYSYLLGQTELFKHFMDAKVRPKRAQFLL